jgi:hypothetical protein
MATTNGRDWVFTHAISESSFKTYEKSGLARRDTVEALLQGWERQNEVQTNASIVRPDINALRRLLNLPTKTESTRK